MYSEEFSKFLFWFIKIQGLKATYDLRFSYLLIVMLSQKSGKIFDKHLTEVHAFHFVLKAQNK